MMFGKSYDQIIEVGNPRDKDVNMKITSVKLNKNPCYSLDIKYELETPTEIREFHLPNVQIPLNAEHLWIGADRGCYGIYYDVDVGFGVTKLNRDSKGNAYYERVIQEKTKEMTLEEIEKKLGHKVKIVSDKK